VATEMDHIALANRNHDVLQHLLQDVESFPEWVTIVAFYKAVQIVDAVLVRNRGRCGHGHHERLESLKAGGHKQLHKHYRALWGASCVARYLYDSDSRKAYSSFTDYLAPQQVEKVIVKRRLAGVECEAVSLLSEEAKRGLKRLPT
jgi:hypothetical protein